MEINLSLIQKYNPWWDKASAINNDEKLKEFKAQKFQYWPREILDKKFQTGVYTILGPRQVGKSTALKLFIQKLLLKEKINPKNIFFFQCDILKNFQELAEVLEVYNSTLSPKSKFYIFLDEISFIKEWPRAIKHLIDRGDLKNAVIFLSGSLSLQVKGGAELLPGRRGKSDKKDFLLLPLDFAKFLSLQDINLPKFKFSDLLRIKNIQILESLDFAKLYSQKNKLQNYFSDYLISGGFLLAINEYLTTKKITDSTFNIYWDALKGDLLKMERKESIFLEIIQESIKHLGSTFSYNDVAKNISIKSHLTVIDYLNLAEKIFLLNIFPNFNLKKKLPNLRKQKKLHFLDPFLFNLLNGRIAGGVKFFATSKQALLGNEPELIEGIVSNFLKTKFPKAGFWRNSLEIDFVGIDNKHIYGFEIKTQERIKLSQIKKLHQLKDFKKIIIVSKNEFKEIDNILIIPYWMLLLIK